MRTPRLWAFRGWFCESLGANVVLVFLVAALFFLALAGPSYFPAIGDLRERARLVEVAESGERIPCGGRAFLNNASEMVYTYRVDLPPEGLPPTFRILGCPDNGEVGDVVTVARSGSGTDAAVTLEPINARQLLAGTLGPAAAVGLLAFLWLAGGEAWSGRNGRHARGW